MIELVENKGRNKHIIVSGSKAILRDRISSDLDAYLKWRMQGEWKQFDAPWETLKNDISEAEKKQLRRRFLDRCGPNLSEPRQSAIITTIDNTPIGWVNRYCKGEHFTDTWFVGIDICEDGYLNRGIGTEALKLWIDYLFANSSIHRIALDTWSFNKRMIHVADKLGFVFEGKERELINWRGKWADLLHFGMLRNEWQC
ncbi:MAG: GNAT family N-acetyltransferase [candidate division Zixibacteria bacterium]|nr:GNAT family N-acetyltransferase [candidate division Zixibacteria bacterium]